MLRRWLYGLFITSWSLHGHVSAAEPPKKPQGRSGPARTHADWESSDAAQVHVATIAFASKTASARSHRHPPLSGDEPSLLTARFNMDATNMISSGIDVDLNLAGVASLHLKVASSAQQSERGRRWAFVSGASGLRDGKACSVSAAMDFIQMAPYGERKLVFVPQLNMALDTMFGAPEGMTGGVRYAHWTAQVDEKGAVGSQIPQMFLRWSF